MSFTFSAFQNLAVSMYLAGSYIPTDALHRPADLLRHMPLAGDHVSDPGASTFTQTTTARYFLSGLDVRRPGKAGTRR